MGEEIIIKLTDLQTQYKIQQIIGGGALGVLVSLPIGIVSGLSLVYCKEKSSDQDKKDTLLFGTIVVCTISGAIVGGYLGNKYARTIKFV